MANPSRPSNFRQSLQYEALADAFGQGESAGSLALQACASRSAIMGRIARYKKAAEAEIRDGRGTEAQRRIVDRLESVALNRQPGTMPKRKRKRLPKALLDVYHPEERPEHEETIPMFKKAPFKPRDLSHLGPAPESKMLRMWELDNNGCLYATESTEEVGDHRFCGHPKDPAGNYCSYHMRVAYTNHRAFGVKSKLD